LARPKRRIAPTDEAVEIDPVRAAGGGGKAERELDRRSNILKSFNEHFAPLFGAANRVEAEKYCPQPASDRRPIKRIAPHGKRRNHHACP
jgi:hypothetical protein